MTGNAQLLIRLPAELKERLDADAEKYGCTLQSMTLWILGQHYGMEVKAPARGRPAGVAPKKSPKVSVVERNRAWLVRWRTLDGKQRQRDCGIGPEGKEAAETYAEEVRVAFERELRKG